MSLSGTSTLAASQNRPVTRMRPSNRHSKITTPSLKGILMNPSDRIAKLLPEKMPLELVAEIQDLLRNSSAQTSAAIEEIGRETERKFAEKDYVIRHLAGMLADSIVLPDDYGQRLMRAWEVNLANSPFISMLNEIDSWRPEVPKSLVDGE